MWILAAQFEIRQLQLTSARKILGTGIGMCPKARLFKEYIALELQLGNIDRLVSRQTCYEMYTVVTEFCSAQLCVTEEAGLLCRCRELYKKYLECFPSSCSAWSKFAEMESSLGEAERVRGIFEVAISRPLLDMPEVSLLIISSCDFRTMPPRWRLDHIHWGAELLHCGLISHILRRCYGKHTLTLRSARVSARAHGSCTTGC